MNKKKLWPIAIILLLVTAAAGVYWYSKSAPQVETRLETPAAGTATVSIEGVFNPVQVSLVEGETALGALQELQIQNPEKVGLKTKEYKGLGVLVEALGSFKNGDGGKYWQYEVNGVMPQIGAGAYRLQNGDAVRWFFAPSQE